jgi:hypothetical protein
MLATVARRGPRNASKAYYMFWFSSCFLNRFFCKIPGFPLKRKLRRAFWPPRPPKAAPRIAQGLPKRPRFGQGPKTVLAFAVFQKHVEKGTFFFRDFVFSCFLVRAANPSAIWVGMRQKGPKGLPWSARDLPVSARDPKLYSSSPFCKTHTEKSTRLFSDLVFRVFLRKLSPPADPQRAPKTPQVAPERS